MITNIVASIVVALVTNVSERFPQTFVAEACPSKDGTVLDMFCGHNANVPNPKEKWILYSVAEVTTLRFDWNGPREVKSKCVITNWTEHCVLDVKWQKTTNSEPPLPFFR